MFQNQSEALKIGRHDKTRGGARQCGEVLFCLDSLFLSHQGERKRNKQLYKSEMNPILENAEHF
jgi:hypothetical protein